MKNDLRVTLTRRMLREALLRLLPQKPLSRITVSELCREAGVNRVTFYNHFETPTAILRDLAWEYAERLRDIYDESRRRQLSEEAALEACLSYLFARKSEIKVLFSDNAENTIGGYCLDIVSSFLENGETLRETELMENDTDRFLYAVTSASAAYGLIQIWMTKDVDKTPKEIAAILKRTMVNVIFT